MHSWYSLSFWPLQAKTFIPSASKYAAISSCVDNGLAPARYTSAPNFFNPMTNTDVSLVTCKHTAIFVPLNEKFSDVLFIAIINVGIFLHAHWYDFLPSSTSVLSAILLIIMFTIFDSKKYYLLLKLLRLKHEYIDNFFLA